MQKQHNEKSVEVLRNSQEQESRPSTPVESTMGSGARIASSFQSPGSFSSSGRLGMSSTSSFVRSGSMNEYKTSQRERDGEGSQNAISIDDYQPINRSAKRSNTGENMASTTKKARTLPIDVEIIDLTDSPRRSSSAITSTYSSPGSDCTASSASTVVISKPRPVNNRPMTYDELLPLPSSSAYVSQAYPSSPEQDTQAVYSRRAFGSQATPQPPKLATFDRFNQAGCNAEQQRIIDLVSAGKNVFFTGSAGVGKSFVLQKITQMFKARRMKMFSDFFITASTGIVLSVAHLAGDAIMLRLSMCLFQVLRLFTLVV